MDVNKELKFFGKIQKKLEGSGDVWVDVNEELKF